LEVNRVIADRVILQLSNVILKDKHLLPESSGIYYVIDETNNVWYIGKSKNICKRWQGKAHHRIYQLQVHKKKKFTIYYEPVSESELDRVEKQRIEKYHPHLNSTPVKTKKLRPVETLLRETITAIADFAFILGVEPPRKEIQSQIAIDFLAKKNYLELNIIHVCLDMKALEEKCSASTEEQDALLKTTFSSRKSYARKWETFRLPSSFKALYFLKRLRRGDYFMYYRLCVNRIVVEVYDWNRWNFSEATPAMRAYNETSLAQESIRTLTPESLAQIQTLADEEERSTLYLKRLMPYESDLIPILFNEPIDRQAVHAMIAKVSEDYKAGQRGKGSRTKPIEVPAIFSEITTIEDLLRYRGIDPEKYSKLKNTEFDDGNKMGLFFKSFIMHDLKKTTKYIIDANHQTHPVYYHLAQGIVNNEKISFASPRNFETVYLLATVDKKAWLLVEEYLKDFASPADRQLTNGVGYIKKFYVSPRKCIVPAKVNIKLDPIGYSAWIPFGPNQEFPTFELAKAEINRRLKNSGLPGLKLSFKREYPPFVTITGGGM